MPLESAEAMEGGRPPRKALDVFLEVRAEGSVDVARERLSKAVV